LHTHVETLEAMTLLSSAIPGHLHALAASVSTSAPVANQWLRLSGEATGRYHAESIPDAGKSYTFRGSGQIEPLELTDVTGNLRLPGLIVPPVVTPVATPPTVLAHGQLFLSDARGTVTLTLSAPSQTNGTKLPPYFSYKITNASGAFRGDTGTGTVVIVVDPDRPPSATTTTTAPSLNEQGSFVMVFLPNPPPLSGAPTSAS
jgi:hypothetical protein